MSPHPGSGARVATLLALLALTARLAAAQDMCGRIPACTNCTMRRVGTVTRLLCTVCASAAGYAPAADQRSCVCAPGFAWNATAAACEACGVGYWCAGGSDAASRGSRTPCGVKLTTTTTRARYSTQCLPLPGNGMAAGSGDAALCPEGTYSHGFSRRPCTRCAGGLTTAAPGARSKWSCACPPGFKFADGAAVPCGSGFYKAGVNFQHSCSACPVGRTTPAAVMAAAGQVECSDARPGYRLVKDGGGAVTGAAACGSGFYSPGGDVTACTACPEGMTTLSTTCGVAACCIAKAGYGFNSTTGSTYACPLGTYKFALGDFPCATCGTGVSTNSTAKTSYQDCYLRVGWGALIESYDPLLMAASRCTGGTYGVEAPVFGPRSANLACQKCGPFTTTADADASLNQTARDAVVNAGPASCLAVAGYAYNASDASAYACPAGSYKGSISNADGCSACGVGLATNSTAKTSYQDCFIPVGWGNMLVSSDPLVVNASRCTGGTYGVASPAYGPDGSAPLACQACPAHMTTNDTNPALSQAQQDAVINAGGASCVTLPGYGYDSGTNSAAACEAPATNAGYNREPCAAP